MARAKKESKPFSLRMDKDTFARLEAYCTSAGQTKTTAIERAVNRYIDEYEERMKKLAK